MNQLLLTASTMCGTFPQLLTSSVGGVSWAVRTDLFVLGRSRKRAKLTLVTPASPPITAALGLRDKVAAAGRHLAHGLQHLSEAESLSVVWNHMWGVSVRDTEHPPSSSKTIGQPVFFFLAQSLSKISTVLCEQLPCFRWLHDYRAAGEGVHSVFFYYCLLNLIKSDNMLRESIYFSSTHQQLTDSKLPFL